MDRVPRLENEHGLGEIEFARDRLQARIVKPLRVDDDRERIAGERRLGEDVEREEAARHAALDRMSAWPGFRARSTPER